MTAIISATLAYLLLYKYVTLFIVAYLAALLIPLPSNTSLIAASAFASQGYLNITVVIVVALAANILGDITGFYISRRYGRSLLLKIGFRKMMESKHYSDLEKFIVRNSKVTIFVTRFIGGIGPLVNILTGLSSNVTYKRFFIYGISGEMVYVFSLSLGGYFLGSAWEEIMTSSEFISIAGILLIIIFLFRKFFMKKFSIFFV